MDLLGTLLRSAQGGSIEQAASQLGLGSVDAQGLLKKLVPAIAGGIKRNTASDQGVQVLSRALSSGNHQRYLDDPTSLKSETTVSDGNAILGHLFGSKVVSREVAQRASAETGLDVSLIKKFLPLAAAATMGAVSKQTSGGASLVEKGTDGVLGMLSGLLDSDNDGSIADDLLSLGKKLL
ncbi:MAG: DUF937 domain-containing protein [Gammaproteobacteria bacterium]